MRAMATSRDCHRNRLKMAFAMLVLAAFGAAVASLTAGAGSNSENSDVVAADPSAVERNESTESAVDHNGVGAPAGETTGRAESSDETYSSTAEAAGSVNPWAAGDAAVLRHLADLGRERVLEEDSASSS